MQNTHEQHRLHELASLAAQARKLIVDAVYTAQAGHLGGPLSAVELLVSLYFDVLHVDPHRPQWSERDRFILSKGHSSIALYAVLALRGYFPVSELDTFDQLDSRLQGHPDMTRLSAIDMSAGSLGQGLSPGVGIALGARRRGSDFRTVVLLGDGELQEGQVWEAAYTASRYQLANLVAIIDHNRLPQYAWQNAGGEGSLLRQPELVDRWKAFGWRVLEADGHDFAALVPVLRQAREGISGGPTVVIAHTVKGKGVSFMENQFSWHAQLLSADLHGAALRELAEKDGDGHH